MDLWIQNYMLFSPWAFPKALNFTAGSYRSATVRRSQTSLHVCPRPSLVPSRPRPPGDGWARDYPRPSRMRRDSAHLMSIPIVQVYTGPAVLKKQPGVLIIWFPFSFWMLQGGTQPLITTFVFFFFPFSLSIKHTCLCFQVRQDALYIECVRRQKVES